jgi:hypothetical protein
LHTSLSELRRIGHLQQVRQVNYVTDLLFQRIQHDLVQGNVPQAMG